MLRWYLYPMLTVDGGKGRIPKYLKYGKLDIDGLPYDGWALLVYGAEDVALIWIDTDEATHATLAAQSDVRQIPEDIDAAIGASAVDNVRAVLEGWNIPGAWVTADDTWREVMRTYCGIAMFAKRLKRRFGTKFVPDGYSLSTRYNQLPVVARQWLTTVADEMGVDYSGMTNQATLRQIGKLFADHWAEQPLGVGGVTL